MYINCKTSANRVEKAVEMYKLANDADKIAPDSGSQIRKFAKDIEEGRAHYCPTGEHSWACDTPRCTSQPYEVVCPECTAKSHGI
jgi:hypothetical protein